VSAARLVLGIDTASRHGSIALAEDGSAACWDTLDPGGHSSGISLKAEGMLGSRGKRVSDLSAVAVSSGPGSFTGLRIGLAWAKGVCFGSPAKLILVSSHKANAHRQRLAAPWIAAVLPGERGEAQVSFWQGGADATLLWGPERVPERELLSALGKTARRFQQAPAMDLGRFGVAIAGPDMKPELREALAQGGYALLDAIDVAGEAGASGSRGAPGSRKDVRPPTAAAVAELGDREVLAGRYADPDSASPVYGRAPNARKPVP
jgi:tRNA threonylcarbamoyl adenosine modification protein YeaZ